MKKLLLTTSTACFAILACQGAFAGNEHSRPNRGCWTMENLELQKKNDPGLEARMEKIESDMLLWQQKNAGLPTTKAVVYIPVVVHVLWNVAAENLADQYIIGAIAALNKDFRKQNPDWTNINTMAPQWANLAADCEIEFCLATVDPLGAATTGITRTQTTRTEFAGGNEMKYTAQGGKDAWSNGKYLNLWSVDFGSSGLLGFATFPGGSSALDGVVCEYKSMPGPPAFNPYDLGRTNTHEIGHWLNLYHTFQGGCAGMSSSNCTTGGDRVCDTPPISSSTFGCPTNTNANSCTEVSPFPPPFTSDQKNMWMNYMDYTDDACMYMFTSGQKTRMVSCLNSSRVALLTSAATNCATGTGINSIALEEYISAYPNPSTGEVFMNLNISDVSSADITVFNSIGEAILSKKVTVPSTKEIKLDLNSKPNGVYLVKIKTSEGTVTKKIVINK